uniref:ATP synthase F0 subunit 8 n=1 Tax=Anaspidinae sp. GENSP01 TaxID=1205605 RepID=A0A0S2MQ73_9CUCU|nr:ATP synthase F0 subunit 8 [Anaspidinae sp. GENSP01]
MPQMSPLNWLTFNIIFFNLFYILLNFINYYSMIYKMKQSLNNKNYYKLNWKW